MDGKMAVNCNGVEIYENEFMIALEEACMEEGIEDLVEVSQRRWKAVLRNVGKRMFPDHSKTLRDKNIVFLEGNKIPTNNNRFDYDVINALCDYYMYLSDRYDKLISAEGFSLFLNIPRETISRWNVEDKLSKTSYHIYKKIQETRLECIKDNAYDNGNVTGTMYVGNVEFGTNMPGVSREQTVKQALTAADLPRLNGSELNKNTLIPDNMQLDIDITKT